MTEVAKASKVSEWVQIGDITPANLQQLRVLNFSTLPVRYSDKFYNELLSIYSGEFMKFAFCNGFVCGGICARIENSPDSNRKRLYIMTLNVFAAYRRRGIASYLLDFVLLKAAENPDIDDVYLHVQISNLDAKEFYIKHGFNEVSIINDYYKRIDPPHCFLFQKNLK